MQAMPTSIRFQSVTASPRRGRGSGGASGWRGSGTIPSRDSARLFFPAKPFGYNVNSAGFGGAVTRLQRGGEVLALAPGRRNQPRPSLIRRAATEAACAMLPPQAQTRLLNVGHGLALGHGVPRGGWRLSWAHTVEATRLGYFSCFQVIHIPSWHYPPIPSDQQVLYPQVVNGLLLQIPGGLVH